MTEGETQEISPIEKYGIKRVRVKVYENNLPGVRWFEGLKPPEIEITPGGKIRGTVPEDEGRYSTLSSFKVEERSKGGHSLNFEFAFRQGLFIGKVTAAIGQSCLSEAEEDELGTAIVDKFINPALAKRGFVLRRDESPPRLNLEGRLCPIRFYHCQP